MSDAVMALKFSLRRTSSAPNLLDAQIADSTLVVAFVQSKEAALTLMLTTAAMDPKKNFISSPL